MFEEIGYSLLTALFSVGFMYLVINWLLKRALGGVNSLTKIGARIAGEASGLSRGSKAAMEDAAAQMLSSPQITGLKMLASQFGFDLDGMIEEHGATETLAGLTQLLSMVGINPTDLLTKGLAGLGKDLLGGVKKSSYDEKGLTLG